uniref:Uncharacterized protein n=1 Tax=Monopterus albus TaxID=43700 RepID=A0A3Q3IJI4_MONAL
VSPTLTVPTPRLSPSPTSLSQGMGLDGKEVKQKKTMKTGFDFNIMVVGKSQQDFWDIFS